jgi:cyclophilin family peptidyl-prolyl cis-trans isomerase
MSDNPTNDIKTALGSGTQGIPLTSNIQAAIMTAAQGGEDTATFFHNQNASAAFMSYLNEQGDAAWNWTVDDQGKPVVFAAQQSGANTIKMVARTLLDQNVIQGQTQPGQFNHDGNTYNIIGSIANTLSYNETPLWYVEVPLGVIELVPLGKLVPTAFQGLLKPILTGFYNGLRSCFTSVAQGEATGVEMTQTVAQNAGEDAAFENQIVEAAGEEVTVSMAAGALAFAGMAVLVAIPFIIQIISHPSFQSVKLYNLTPYNLTWNDPYMDEGVMNLAPVTAVGTTSFNYSVPAISSFSPGPDIQPVTSAHEADFSFASTSELKGLGWAMSFHLDDPANNNQQVASAAVAFDIPYWGTNSLYASFGDVSDLKNYYSKMEGVNKTTSYQTTTTTPDGKTIKLQVTYDYLDGKHPSPSGQNMYYYNSMIVFSVG